MAKLWAGRSSGETAQAADDFNSSIRFDSRMFREDIRGSMAHAMMLGATGILTHREAEELIAGLETVLADLESGALAVDPQAEDIHMFVEQVLTERLGDLGKKLHTARSRNDQVALDLRMYLRGEIDAVSEHLRKLLNVLCGIAEREKETILPGYTHLQRAQPVNLGHHLLAYAMMLLRDLDRLADCRRRVNVSPIGCCALAGTTFPTDRVLEAEALGFEGVALNSLDGVSDRDFCLELLSDLSLVMLHLSRLSEELILWSSWEFRFVELSDAYTTGSSIMPQKKNPDMAELCRGKTGRVYGDLVALLTVMKGLPLAYNKDMQEDKEAVFDACDTVRACLDIMAPMLETMTVRRERMLSAAREGFINATDLADYLVGKGLPFRSAYKISGALVTECARRGCVLETLPLEDYQAVCPEIGEDVYEAVDLRKCLERRKSLGGASPDNVDRQIAYVRKALEG